MGDGARRDADIQQHKKITQPKPSADGGCVLDTFADRGEIMRVLGKFFDGVRRRGGLFRPRPRTGKPPLAKPPRHLYPLSTHRRT
jgi:hypothetical protein